MILEESEAIERMESPANLLNRLRNSLSKAERRYSNGNDKAPIVSIPPTANQVIEDLEEKLKFGTLKSKAAGIMTEALDELKGRLAEVKPEKLAQVAAEMNKIVVAQVESQRDKNDNAPQVILYAPSFVSEEHFETIHVRE